MKLKSQVFRYDIFYMINNITELQRNKFIRIAIFCFFVELINV